MELEKRFLEVFNRVVEARRDLKILNDALWWHRHKTVLPWENFIQLDNGIQDAIVKLEEVLGLLDKIEPQITEMDYQLQAGNPSP